MKPSANFGKVTAFAAISALVIPNGETLKVYSSPTTPVPSRVNVVFVAPITSLPIMPSVSVIVKVESSTSIQSVPSHCINCPAVVPSANFGKVTAFAAISALVIPNGETLKVYSSPTTPVPSSVNVVLVAPITSLPIIPSASAIAMTDWSTNSQSVPLKRKI